MSFLNSNAKLNSYSEKENVFFLDFNTNLYDSKDKVLEEVIYSISYSIFDNYDVGSIVFSVDGKNIKTVSLMDDTKSKTLMCYNVCTLKVQGINTIRGRYNDRS